MDFGVVGKSTRGRELRDNLSVPTANASFKPLAMSPLLSALAKPPTLAPFDEGAGALEATLLLPPCVRPSLTLLRVSLPHP